MTGDQRRRFRATCPAIFFGRSRRLLATIAATVLWAAAAAPDAPSAPASKPTEYQVKAAYLFNFGKFIRWPSAAKSDSFSICVLGRDPFGPVLEATFSGETIEGRKVVPVRVARAQDAAACQIVFISASESARLNEIFAALAKASVLTVSDMLHFTERGGMIQFLLEGDRVRFEVNLAAAQRAGLNPSSELLKVATTVRTTPRRESE